MLNAQSIIAAAKSECGTELSKQAIAVINAVCIAANVYAETITKSMQVLELQASSDKEKQLNAVKHTPTGRMKRPSIEEVREQGIKIELPVYECEKFFDFYQSKDWKVGAQPMKLWTAALSNWKRTWMERGGQTPKSYVPTLKDVSEYAKEKDPQAAVYAVSWHQYWTGKNWRRNGIIIDWRIEFSKSYATHKQQKETK